MVGFTEPNRYEPRGGWRATLAEWVRSPPGPEGNWRNDVALYWRWRTLEGRPLGDAWKALGMEPTDAQAALAASPDSGLVPTELFSRMLARSRADEIDHNDDVADVVIAATPPTEPPDKLQVGFDPDRRLYQPRGGWKARLADWVQFPPGNVVAFPFDLSMYWRKRTKEGMSLQQAWAELRMTQDNARTSLHKDLEHRGMIPPELIGRVVARSRGSTNPNDEVPGIILYAELTK